MGFFDEEDIEEKTKGSFFDETDIESDEESVTPEEEEISQLESAAKGAVQGSTLALSDELGAALLAPGMTEGGQKMAAAQMGGGMVPGLEEEILELQKDSPEAVEQQLKEQGFTGDIEGYQGLLDKYKELRDVTRKSNIEAQEANPYTYFGAELAGGILPAIASGGAAATGKVLAPAAQAGVKELAKTGAKYGGAYGFGASEEEDILGLAKDTAKGAALGAGTGVLAPMALKGAASGAKAIGKGGKALLKTLPGAEDIATSFKYGRKGRKIEVGDVDEDLMKLADTLYNRIRGAKKDIGIKEVKAELDALGIKVDTSAEVNAAIDDLGNIAKGDFFDGKSNKVLEGLKKLRGDDLEGQRLAESLEKSSLKKTLQGANQEEQAIIKGEKAAMKRAELAGEEIDSITDVSKSFDDITEIPTETVGGRIGGTRSKIGEDVVETLSDTTPYQPTQIKTGIDPNTGLPFAVQKDLGSGKVTAQVGKLTEKIEKDLANMTVDEVDNVITQINVQTKIATNEGYSNDPAIKRAIRLAGDLRKAVNSAVSESGAGDELIAKRARMSDIMSAEDLLNINQPKSLRPDINEQLQKIEIGDKLGFEKGFKQRGEAGIAEELLSPQLKGGLGDEFKEMQRVNKLLGRESAKETITKSSLYSQIIGKVPNVVGRGVKSAVESKPYQMSKNLVNLPKESLQELVTMVETSENAALKKFLNPLTNAMKAENKTTRDALLWSMAQQPAFREGLRQMLPADVDIISEASASDEIPMDSDNDFKSFIDDTVIDEHEKGYQNNKKDAGNYVEQSDGSKELIGTNFGISAPTLKRYLGRDITVDDMKNLTKEEASDILYKDYYTEPKIDKLPKDIQKNVFDYYMNSGPVSIRQLQIKAGVTPDGIIGPNTIEAFSNLTNEDIVNTRVEMIQNSNKIDESLKPGLIKRANSFLSDRGPASEPISGMSQDTESMIAPAVEPERMSEQVTTQEKQANPYQALLDEFNATSKTLDMTGLGEGEVEHVESQIRANRDLEDVETSVPKGERIENTRKIFPELDRLHKMVSSGGMDNEYIIEDIIGLIEQSFYSPEDSRRFINLVMEADSSQEVTNLMRDMEKTHLENIMREYKQ